MDRSCQLPVLGEVDEEAGEFWVENITQLPKERKNLSAFERNRLFMNTSDAEFMDVSFASGVDIDSDSRAVVATDFNQDGRTDLLVGSVGGGPLRLFLNQCESGNRVRVRLKGTDSNRSGIGTRIIAETTAGRVIRDVFPANGFMGIAPADAVIGLGGDGAISKLTLQWPSGTVQTLSNVPANGEIIVTEGQAEPKIVRTDWP